VPGGVVSNKPLFESPDHYLSVVGVVQENPKRPGESFFEYLDRIAVESALLKAGEGLWSSGRLKSERAKKKREQAEAITEEVKA
jgi:hypothetical protein